MLNRSQKVVKNRYVAFSLPEIIIVIGIIGLFAMLILSPFLDNSDKNQYVTRLKKSYAEFNEALLETASSNGCVNDLKCTGLFDAGTNDDTFGDELIKHFRTVKNCRSFANLGCMSSNVSTHYDGASARTNFDEGNYRFTAVNGVSFAISNYANGCQPAVSQNSGNNGCSNDNNGSGNGNNGNNNNSHDNNGNGNGNNGNGTSNVNANCGGMPTNMSQVCGTAYIDVNGPMKGPNNVGRDIFPFWITNGKGPMLYPMGGKNDITIGWWLNENNGAPKYCYPGQTHAPWCSGRVMEENWKMNY